MFTPLDPIQKIHRPWLLAILLGAVLCSVGCQSLNPNANAQAFDASNTDTGNTLSGIKANADAASASLDAARPHADPVGQGAVDAAKRSTVQISTQQIPAAQASNAAAAAAFAAEHVARVAGDVENAALKMSWLSYRQKQELTWTVIGVGIPVVVLVILFFSTGFGPVIGEVAVYAFHFLTGGLVKLGAWIDDELTARLAAGRAKAATATPPSPPVPPASSASLKLAA